MTKHKKKKKKLSSGYQPWIDAQKRFHLSHAHIQMARELGMNPKKLRLLSICLSKNCISDALERHVRMKSGLSGRLFRTGSGRRLIIRPKNRMEADNIYDQNLIE